MRFQSLVRRISVLIAAAAAAAVVVAGCGSSGGSGGSSSTSSRSATPSPAASAAAAIKANWVAFFSASTPVDRRVALLQDGKQFRPLITAQSKSAIASSASAKVTKVTDISSSRATVTYSILVGGTSALSGRKGVAVYQNGTWKVGVASFCGLLGLEKSSALVKITRLPAACAPAG
jgi:hypothetical protein